MTDDGLEALLDVIYREYHYDFRAYSRPSLLRGISRAQSFLGVGDVESLVELLANDRATFEGLLRHLTIPVSDLFRDPSYYAALRERVVPHLATYPSPRVWVAGCGRGEEAYSVAIILHEEGLLDRCLIYATDISAHALETAEAGVYDADRVDRFAENYSRAGGRAALSDYYTADASEIVFSSLLRDRILFSDHSLATDAAFAEVQLVSCRNVMIYFGRDLQGRAVGLFREALCPRGFLGLGSNESLAYSDHVAAFQEFAPEERLYRLKEPLYLRES